MCSTFSYGAPFGLALVIGYVGPQCGLCRPGLWDGSVFIVASKGSESMQIVSCRYPRWLPVLLVASFLSLSFASSAAAYTPDSPEVRRMAAAAMAYLEEKGDTQQGGLLGGQALVALAAYKYNLRYGNSPHTVPPLTRAGVERAVNDAGKPRTSDKFYSTGIALMLLSDVYPEQHVAAMTRYLQELLQNQKAEGGWGYQFGRHKDACDLSQTQYAVLGLWSAKQAGIDVPEQSMVNVVNYIMRVQDPGGGWPYQGKDPGHYNRVEQARHEIQQARTAAGLGSLYVGADFLRLLGEKDERDTDSNHGLPPVLVPVEERKDGAAARASTGINLELWTRAVRDGHQWFSNKSLQAVRYQYYHLYAMERLYTFKEKLENTPPGNPRWYDEGVELLRKLQSEDGSWGTSRWTSQCCTSPVATAFGVLFLVRSTRLMVEGKEQREGVLRGGHGLPSDLTEARVRGGRIVGPPITGEVEDLITMLEDEEGEKIERMLENPGTLSLSGESGDDQSSRLARIVRGGQSYKARMVAARALGRQDNLDNVPVLIHALTDPDPRVVRAARDALRLISRKFSGFGLSDEPSADDVESVVKRWKAWYRSVRPDAAFFSEN